MSAMVCGGSLLGKDGGCVSSGRALSAVTMGGGTYWERACWQCANERCAEGPAADVCKRAPRREATCARAPSSSLFVGSNGCSALESVSGDCYSRPRSLKIRLDQITNQTRRSRRMGGHDVRTPYHLSIYKSTPLSKLALRRPLPRAFIVINRVRSPFGQAC